MNISKFSTRLQELSDAYSSQRVMPDEYRAERKIILDEIDNLMNGVDYTSPAENNASEALTVVNAVNINGDINIVDGYDNDTNIDLRNVKISDHVDASTNFDSSTHIEASKNIDTRTNFDASSNVDVSNNIDVSGIENDTIIKDDMFMDKAESAEDVSGVKAIGKKLNNILGRLNKPDDDNKT